MKVKDGSTVTDTVVLFVLANSSDCFGRYVLVVGVAVADLTLVVVTPAVDDAVECETAVRVVSCEVTA